MAAVFASSARRFIPIDIFEAMNMGVSVAASAILSSCSSEKPVDAITAGIFFFVRKFKKSSRFEGLEKSTTTSASTGTSEKLVNIG